MLGCKTWEARGIARVSGGKRHRQPIAVTTSHLSEETAMRRHIHLTVAFVATALLAACGGTSALVGPTGGAQERDYQHEALVNEYMEW